MLQRLHYNRAPAVENHESQQTLSNCGAAGMASERLNGTRRCKGMFVILMRRRQSLEHYF